MRYCQWLVGAWLLRGVWVIGGVTIEKHTGIAGPVPGHAWREAGLHVGLR